jgi:hypothetical protein
MVSFPMRGSTGFRTTHRILVDTSGCRYEYSIRTVITAPMSIESSELVEVEDDSGCPACRRTLTI